MTAPEKKVALDQLLFAQSWEDPALDRAAMPMRGGRVATVGSGGCNALTFLLDEPEYLLAFDYNPTQVWLLELKRAAFATLEWGEVLELFGVRSSQRRQQLMSRAMVEVSPEAKRFWESQAWVAEHGLLNGGRYERFVALFRVLLRTIHGRRKLEALFVPRSRQERADFYANEWDTLPWRLIFKAFFNKRVLARRGLSADYFHYSTGPQSFAESFAQRTTRALVELDVSSNPFLAQYVLGRYLDEDHLPEYLQRDNFDTVRACLGRLDLRWGDVRDLFEARTASFDAICLSNVFELMSPEETARVLPRVAMALRPCGKMTLRNLMVPRSGGSELDGLAAHDERLSAYLHDTDRSFVYRSFHVYSRSADAARTKEEPEEDAVS